jgi:hypothetical protein
VNSRIKIKEDGITEHATKGLNGIDARRWLLFVGSFFFSFGLVVVFCFPWALRFLNVFFFLLLVLLLTLYTSTLLYIHLPLSVTTLLPLSPSFLSILTTD